MYVCEHFTYFNSVFSKNTFNWQKTKQQEQEKTLFSIFRLSQKDMKYTVRQKIMYFLLIYELNKTHSEKLYNFELLLPASTTCLVSNEILLSHSMFEII